MITLKIPGRPVPWQRSRQVLNKKTGKPFFFDGQAKTRKSFQTQIVNQVAPWRPNEKLYRISCIFAFKIPKSRPNLKPGEIFHHKGSYDVDNLLKFVLDCLQPIVVVNDSQVCAIGSVRRIYDASDYTFIQLTEVDQHGTIKRPG